MNKIDYKEKYEQALNRAKVINPGTADYEVAVKIFPELKESEDERIIKELIEYLYKKRAFEKLTDKERIKKEWIDWLEKQGGQKSAKSRYETKPNGSIIYEDFYEGDGYYKMNLAYLSKSQVELIENLVASWQNFTNNTTEWSEEDEEIIKCLNTYLDELEEKNRWHYIYVNYKNVELNKIRNWLKSLKERMKGE